MVGAGFYHPLDLQQKGEKQEARLPHAVNYFSAAGSFAPVLLSKWVEFALATVGKSMIPVKGTDQIKVNLSSPLVKCSLLDHVV